MGLLRASVAPLTLLASLSACQPETGPAPETPKRDPQIARSEMQRSELLSAHARPGDFRANFGEPFIAFENRGARMVISQPYEEPTYRVDDVVRETRGETITFRGTSTVIDSGGEFLLTIEPGDCVNEFSGERTGFNAYLGSPAQPRRLRSCAAPAR